MNKDKQSPLKTPPLRNPGQSTDEAFDDIVGDRFPVLVMVAAAFVAVCVYEWTNHLLVFDPSPIPITIITGLVVTACVWRGRGLLRRARNFRLGRDGEVVVGQVLEELRPGGYEVVHDIAGPEWNIDHVIVGPAGVFAIETKTRSKSKDDRVHYDGEQLIVGGGVPDRAPIDQAEAGARWIAEQIKAATGTWQQVRPVVVFPGWFVEPPQAQRFNQRVWVINPKEIWAALRQQSRVLEQSEIKTIAHALKCHVRTYRKAA